MSRFLQGDGYPILYIYENNLKVSEYKMPYVRDQGTKSYIRQYFKPYPDNEILQHKLLSGDYEEDLPSGYNLTISIKYASIQATQLQSIYNLIKDSKSSATRSLKIKPRHNHSAIYSVLYKGDFLIESDNMWRHVVTLEFITSELISDPPFVIPN